MKVRIIDRTSPLLVAIARASFMNARQEHMYRVRDRGVVPLHVYAGTGLAGSSELFIPRGCFMNNIIYIVGVVVIIIAVLSFFGFR